MRYEVVFHPGALREFDKLPKPLQGRVAQAIDRLAGEPRPEGTLHMQAADAYRLRVGEYRIAYGVRDTRLLVLIVKVGHRRDIYKEMETIKRRLNEPDTSAEQ